VLLVEDEETSRMMARVLLERAGGVVTTAVTGAEALACANADRFDLILLDLGLPDMDGGDVARTLRATDSARTVPIVAMTATLRPEQKSQLAMIGIGAVLAKPVDAAQLRGLLNDLPAADGGPAIFDRGALDSHLAALGPVIVSRIADQFLAALPDYRTHLAKAAGEPLPDTARLAHRLAGGALTVGLPALAAAATALENAAKAGNQPAIDGLVGAVLAALGDGERELERYREGLTR
jgi:CheY-like chemotaxis protein